MFMINNVMNVHIHRVTMAYLMSRKVFVVIAGLVFCSSLLGLLIVIINGQFIATLCRLGDKI